MKRWWGKTRAIQAALGPAIGWTKEGLEAKKRPQVNVVQTVYNFFEQTPGDMSY